MNEKQRAAWEKTRKQGFDWYVVKYTLLIGVMFPALNLITSYLFDGSVNTRELLSNIIFALLFGFLNSWISYEWNEYSYKKGEKNKG